jgi:hypothetical protein
MSWNDNILFNVFDPRVIGVNLFEWFAENQADALAWANEGSDGTLPDVKDFFQNARTPTRFPVCMLERIGYRSKTGEDLADIEIALQYSIQLVHGNQDWLAAAAPKYAMAFESMSKNVPQIRLEKDSKIVFRTGVLVTSETTFDFLRSDGNQFMQEFTTQINWECDFSNYRSE